MKIKINGPALLRDVFVFGGLGLMGYGLWLFLPWVAFAVVGAVIMVLGLFPVRT